jgi:hypothetical protein
MKLRIRADTVRLRLKRGEVEQLAAGDSIVGETHFPGSVLTYRLDLSDNGAISAAFGNGTLVVSVPRSAAVEWATTDQVSLSAEQALADNVTLSLLIEKDFSCLAPGRHRHSEDDEDTYAHPHSRA